MHSHPLEEVFGDWLQNKCIKDKRNKCINYNFSCLGDSVLVRGLIGEI